MAVLSIFLLKYSLVGIVKRYVGEGYAAGTESRPHRDSLPTLGDYRASQGDRLPPIEGIVRLSEMTVCYQL